MRCALALLAALALPVTAVSDADSSRSAAGARTPPLASSVQAEEQVAWSPDGRWIAFPNAIGTSRGLTLVRADGRGEWFVGPSFGASWAAWSPSGRHLAWSTLSARRSELLVARPAGTSVQRVEVNAGAFSWSPDGTRLAYLRRKPGFHPAIPPFSAMVFDLPDGTRREVATAPLTGATWSSDGSEIAFRRLERVSYGCSSSIGVVPAGGGAERRVAGGAFEIWEAHWSPDGVRIAYVSTCGRQNENGLYIVGRDGTGARRLDTRWWQDVAWSPDGTLIAGIVVGVPRRLVVRQVDGPGVWEFGRYPSTFTWSPDSRRLLISTGGVSVAEIAGGERVLIDEGFAADWSPDGHRIAFVRKAYARPTPFRTCALHLWVADADGGNPQPISRCRIRGSGRSERIWGTAGSDDIDGFRGRDSIGAGRGADLVRARDAAADRISCGPGTDRAEVDRRDRVSGDCEVVHRR